MKKAHGLRKYFYEYVFYKAVDRARDQTSEIIPISQAKAIRARVDEMLASNNSSVADPTLAITPFLSAVDNVLTESVDDYEPQFGDHSSADPRYQALQREFVGQTGVGAAKPNPKTSRLPISPYDPDWSERASIKHGGTALSYLPDETIERVTKGEVASLAEARHGNMMLWRLDADGKPFEAGRALTYEDASGLSALMPLMSQKEYDQVRHWVIDGGRNPRTGTVDASRFMSSRALDRSVAILEDLRSQGISYEVTKDRRPGQIKAVISGTAMEIRLTDTRENEDYAGARVYDNGLATRFSTNHRVERGRSATYSPTPEEAVKLVRFSLGQGLERDDKPGVKVGTVGHTHPEVINRKRGVQDVPDAYHGGKESMFAFKDYVAPGESHRKGSKVMLRRENENRTLPTFFVDAEVAEKFVSEAVSSARENLEAALDVESLIKHYEEQLEARESEEDQLEPPAYSADVEVAAIQRSYWDVLTGERENLLRPGAPEEMFAARLEAIGELREDEALDVQLNNLVYIGTPMEKIRDHAADVPFELIGTWEAEPHQIDGQVLDKRFDPARTAKYMTSSTGKWSNLDNLASALRRCEVDADELLGSGFQSTRFKDRLVRFNPDTAVPLETHPSAFMRRVGETVRASLEDNATVPDDAILVDDRGVIQWSGEKIKRDGSVDHVRGQIGQVFDIGEYGEIVTSFASGENALVVPGYEARIVAQAPGENKSVEERTRLRGYEQLMLESVQYQIAGDLMSGRSEVGEPASLNGVYSRLYGTKHPVDFLERAAEFDAQGDYDFDEPFAAQNELDPWVASIVATEARRVRYSNEIKQGSTIYAEYQAGRDISDPANDNFQDIWQITQRNMAVLTGKDAKGDAIPEGFFDPVMTGGATNQGIVRYLTQDAQVNQDGSIVPGDPTTLSGVRAPLMNRPELESLRFDPFDRQQMTASTIMQSSKVTKPTGTALMTFGGWTADDPIVVSKEFAQEHQIRGAGGQLRDLVVGDKLSDLHGNKGVISLVVDREMDPKEAREQDLEREVQWFKDNRDMDVVMSPFSLISRRNAGSARELMASEREDLLDPYKTAQQLRAGDVVTPAGIGQMRFVVTHMAVDEKTKIYDDQAVREGRGRKASSQLAWALQSQDCPAIMAEFYGHNSGAEANLREYLTSVGLDMEADGTLGIIGQVEPLDERPERRLFEMPELVLTAPRTDGGTPGLNSPAMRRTFGELIGDKGGDLEIPFPLTYPTGEQTEQVSGVSWKMPVLSSHLRSSQEFDDGTSVTHDYTRYYQDVHMEACKYRYAAERLEDNPEMKEEIRTKLVDEMSESIQRAQRSFDAVNSDIERRVLSGKNNIFKTGLMASRLSDSATMVWTGDPRLDIDQIALSSVKAEQLGLKENDHALVWRDPVLRDAGVRYMRVAIDDRLTGAAINPVMDACFDGDFDGDAVGVAKLHTEAARQEAYKKLSVPANLLDTGVVSDRGTHPFAIQLSLDTQVALSKSKELRRTLMGLSGEANLNAVEPNYPHEDVNEGMRQRNWDGNVALVGHLSDFYRSAQRNEFGSALTFSDREAHLTSVREVCVETGAKGSLKKLEDYARYLGDDAGTPGITQEDQEASMFATAIKAHGTGLGGSFSQRAVRALRGDDLKAVLEVTYPVTQSILQAKHDAAEARHKYEMLQGPGRELWRGRKIEHRGSGIWKAEYQDGNAVQATTEEWKQQFTDFYKSPVGFNVDVNPTYVDRVARALTDPKTGLIRNLEEDPSLRGTLMDRMAYSGDFKTLVEAAKNRESVYDGEKNTQFASAATRKAIGISRGALEAYEAGASISEVLDGPSISATVLKPDVLADREQGAKVRGSSRRSEHVTAVRTPAGFRPAYRPSIEIENEQQDETYGMEA